MKMLLQESHWHTPVVQVARRSLEFSPPFSAAIACQLSAIGVQLLCDSPLFARLSGFGLQPPPSFSAKVASLLCRLGVENTGSMVFAARCLVKVFRDTPVCRAILRIDNFWRKCICRMMLKSPMRIASSPLSRADHRWGWREVHLAQRSVKIMSLAGSILGEDQQLYHL
jgi:hypothetical protein